MDYINKKENNSNSNKNKIIITSIIILTLSLIYHNSNSSNSSNSSNIDNNNSNSNNEINKSNKITLIKQFNFNHKSQDPETDFELDAIDGQWNYFQFGEFIGNQATMSKEYGYLRIDSNPFTNTVYSSLLDHIKFLVQTESAYKVPNNGELIVTFNSRAQTFNTDQHPFGDLVSDANSDFRLALGVLNVYDLVESNIVADFFITNNKIYMLYERLPFGRSVQGNYASFAYAIPVADRTDVDEFHILTIIFSKETKSIKWFVGEQEVFRVTKVGHHLEDHQEYMLFDKGGEVEEVFPDSLNIAFGTFSLLDSTFPESSPNKGLVRLSESPNEYKNPLSPEKTLEFFDEKSTLSNRIFGQGCVLDIKDINVYIKH